MVLRIALKACYRKQKYNMRIIEKIRRICAILLIP